MATTTGKRNNLSLNAVNDYDFKTRRLFVTDQNTKINFLVNLGADLYTQENLFEANYVNQTMNFQLLTEQSSKHTELLTLNFGLRCNFIWRFVDADVCKPIIGADFLSSYGLLIHFQNNQLIDQVTNLRAIRRAFEVSHPATFSA